MRRHSTDAVSLSFGLIFVAIAGWWLTGRYVEVDIPNLGWFVAAALIVVGVLGVVGSLRRERGGSAGAAAAAQDQATPPDEAAPHHKASPRHEDAPPVGDPSAPHSPPSTDPGDTRFGVDTGLDDTGLGDTKRGDTR